MPPDRGEIPAESAGRSSTSMLPPAWTPRSPRSATPSRQFATHPDQYELLREDPSLIPSAFNEILRYEALMIAQGRLVKEDVEVDGTVIPAGSHVAVLFGVRQP